MENVKDFEQFVNEGYEDETIEDSTIDLFETTDQLPEEVQTIISKYNELYDSGEMEYEDTENYQKELNNLGYTFDFGLDNVPYNLRKI